VKWNLDGSQAVTLIPQKQANLIFRFIGFVLQSMSAELHDGEDESFFSLSGHNIIMCLLMFSESWIWPWCEWPCWSTSGGKLRCQKVCLEEGCDSACSLLPRLSRQFWATPQ